MVMACGPKAEYRSSDSWHFQEFVLARVDHLRKEMAWFEGKLVRKAGNSNTNLSPQPEVLNQNL